MTSPYNFGMGVERELAIVFADVVGSTRLYEQLGDKRASETVGLCIRLMRQATEEFRGTVIKTMGDEVMATFASADDALSAAAEMQQSIGEQPLLSMPDGQVAIRIGCHFGPVVIEHRDVFGAAVATANRMTSQAKPGQIITTAAMVAQLGSLWRSAVRQVDLAAIKGASAEVMVYEVFWQEEQEDVTSMLRPLVLTPAARHSPSRLVLRASGREYLVDARQAAVTVGRAEDNDLVLKGNLVSRLHARIELSRSRFVLTDQSTNGCFVVPAGGAELFVRRDSLVLQGSGVIGLGQSPETGAPQTLEYSCEE